MTTQQETWTDKPWFWHPTRNRIQASDLRVGDVVTGTGPSGDFDDEPVPVRFIEPAVAKDGRREVVVNREMGHLLHYYADTVLEISERPTYKDGRVVR